MINKDLKKFDQRDLELTATCIRQSGVLFHPSHLSPTSLPSGKRKEELDSHLLLLHGRASFYVLIPHIPSSPY